MAFITYFTRNAPKKGRKVGTCTPSGERALELPPIVLPGTHHIAESVISIVRLASEEGAVMSCGLVPGSMEIVGHEINKIQVSEEWR